MATMLDGVTVTDVQAKKIVKIAIEQNAYDSDMPGTKKERIEAAHEIIAFCIDAWKTDGARPDDDDPEIAEGAEAILKIFKVVGIEADDDGTITMPDDEDEDDDEDEVEDDDDEEGPFEPDDYIEGYSELTAKSKIAKLKELDPEDDDDLAILEAIKDWEEQQDKPSSRVLDVLTDLVGEDEDDEDEEYDEDDEDEDDEDLDEDEDDDEDEDEEELEEEEEDEEDEEDDDDEEEEDDEDLGEPWDGYDKLKVTEIKAQLNEMFDDDELTVEQLEYVKEYEEAQDQPSKRTLKLCDELIAKLGDSDDSDDDEDDEDEVDDPPVSKGKKLYISVGGKVVATLPAKGGELTIAVK